MKEKNYFKKLYYYNLLSLTCRECAKLLNKSAAQIARDIKKIATLKNLKVKVNIQCLICKKEFALKNNANFIYENDLNIIFNRKQKEILSFICNDCVQEKRLT